MQPTTGTTIVACRFVDGVVIGCDTRMTLGAYVCNRACEKIAELYDNVYLARSGSAADAQTVSDYVRRYAEQHAIAIGDQPSVKTLANLVKLINYRNKFLISATIVAGWDKTHGGRVYAVPIGGTFVEENWVVEGSGSTYIWGICDHMYHGKMTKSEAESFVTTALSCAIARDGASGGMIRYITVTSEGAERQLMKPKDMPLLLGQLGLPDQDVEMQDA